MALVFASFSAYSYEDNSTTDNMKNSLFDSMLANNDELLERVTIKKCERFFLDELGVLDKKLCFDLIKRGVKKNKSYSFYILGKMLIHGKNIEKDEDLGKKYIIRAQSVKSETKVEIKYSELSSVLLKII
jgi:TPR repeat protein